MIPYPVRPLEDSFPLNYIIQSKKSENGPILRHRHPSLFCLAGRNPGKKQSRASIFELL